MKKLRDRTLKLHKKLRGKIEIRGKWLIKSSQDLSMIYTPGVAEVAKAIYFDNKKVYDYTSKWNNVAIVTDGSRLLGLGNVGPEAALPVMEGKALLFKQFGKINAFPICLATQDKHDIIKIVEQIAPAFAAINIEDIESPKCLEIVEHLQQELSIPIFHDDQHGTATVVLAALINALKLVKKALKEAKIVVVGAGAAGYGIVKILNYAGANNIIVVDSAGIIYEQRSEHMNSYKEEIAKITNRDKANGSLEDALKEADVFVGASGKANLITKQIIRNMSRDAVVFALTNPIPEIMPEIAKQGGAKIVATGRSDYYNQVNNALIFPFILRVALDFRIPKITQKMLVDVAINLAKLQEKKLDTKHILPSINDMKILPAISKAISA